MSGFPRLFQPYPSPPVQFVGAHIRLGQKHTSNYVVPPKDSLGVAFRCIDEAMKEPHRLLFLATGEI